MAKKSKSTTSTPQPKPTAAITPDQKLKATAPKTAPPAVQLARQNDDTEEATPATRRSKRKAPLDEPSAAQQATSTPTTRSSSSKKPKVAIHTAQATLASSATGKKSSLRHTEAAIEVPVATPNQTKHIRFDDVEDEGEENDGEEGPSEFHTPLEAPVNGSLEAELAVKKGAEGVDGEEEEEDDGEGESDDEAPEAVSTSASAAQAAKAAQAAAHAAERAQEELRRKRQERDAKLKQQRAESRRSRQTATEEAPKAMEPARNDAPPSSRLPDISATKTNPSSRKRLDKRSLPSVLPDEFLASDSEEEGGSDDDDDENDAAAGGRRPKKIKFNTAARQVARSEGRHPVDQQVGQTVYRVMKKQGPQTMAPSGGKYSRNAKEMLLGRGRAAGGGAAAKRKGFLVKR